MSMSTIYIDFLKVFIWFLCMSCTNKKEFPNFFLLTSNFEMEKIELKEGMPRTCSKEKIVLIIVYRWRIRIQLSTRSIASKCFNDSMRLLNSGFVFHHRVARELAFPLVLFGRQKKSAHCLSASLSFIQCRCHRRQHTHFYGYQYSITQAV